MYKALLSLSELLALTDEPFVLFVTDLERYSRVLQKKAFIDGIVEGEQIRDFNVRYCLREKKDVFNEKTVYSGTLFEVWISPIIVGENVTGCCGLFMQQIPDATVLERLRGLNMEFRGLNQQLEDKLRVLKDIKNRIEGGKGGFESFN